MVLKVEYQSLACTIPGPLPVAEGLGQRCKLDTHPPLGDSFGRRDPDLSAAAAVVVIAVGRLSAHRVRPCCHPRTADVDTRSAAEAVLYSPLTIVISVEAVAAAVEVSRLEL